MTPRHRRRELTPETAEGYIRDLEATIGEIQRKCRAFSPQYQAALALRKAVDAQYEPLVGHPRPERLGHSS